MVARTQVDTPLRVVLDTNVILSALLFKAGRVSWVLDYLRSGKLVPLVSKETVRELLRVLAYPKFALTPQEQGAVIEAFLPYAEVVDTGRCRSHPECRDPHDVPFLVLAIKGKAEYLVTGDRDLLAVQGVAACPIVTPEHFLRIVSGTQGQG
jgi:putative PIN family toxin of toxin-antitoxin system